ncbi:hypothetical protein JTB14_000593 [Gonioctena quinquepunctata]|nr:hypothetical protein JTB14_000593 [Gonioctena quinquepunctata]
MKGTRKAGVKNTAIHTPNIQLIGKGKGTGSYTRLKNPQPGQLTIPNLDGQIDDTSMEKGTTRESFEENTSNKLHLPQRTEPSVK